MSEPLSELLDCKALRAELGVSRTAAEAIMRRLPIVQIEGLLKTAYAPTDSFTTMNAVGFYGG